MKESILKKKSFLFAIDIINCYKKLSTDREYVLSKQLLRSGTSIGANIREAQNAQSTKDFIHKLSISQKECDETMYRIELLQETNYLTPNEAKKLLIKATELLKMLRSAIITSKKRL